MSGRRLIGGAVAITAPTTPLSIFLTTPPMLWIRADLGVTNSSGSASAAADQSGGGHNMAALVLAPTITATDVTLNNLQTLLFASGQALSTALVRAVPYSLLLIFKPTVWNNANAVAGDGSNATGQIIDAGGVSPTIYQQNGSFGNNSNAGTLGAWCRVSAKFTNSAGDALKVGAAASVSGANAGAGSLANMSLNAISGLPGVGSFAFYELVVLPGIATAGEYSAYDAYVTTQTAGAAAV